MSANSSPGIRCCLLRSRGCPHRLQYHQSRPKNSRPPNRQAAASDNLADVSKGLEAAYGHHRQWQIQIQVPLGRSRRHIQLLVVPSRTPPVPCRQHSDMSVRISRSQLRSKLPRTGCVPVESISVRDKAVSVGLYAAREAGRAVGVVCMTYAAGFQEFREDDGASDWAGRRNILLCRVSLQFSAKIMQKG